MWVYYHTGRCGKEGLEKFVEVLRQVSAFEVSVLSAKTKGH